MTALTALAYVSSATGLLSEAELERLLVDARAHNAQAGITGALLYDEGNFFQYLEGPQLAIDDAWARINASRRHHGLILLFRRSVPVRQFEGWQMGFARAPRSLTLRLSQADWLQAWSESSADPDPPSGVKVLLDYWRGTLRRS